LDAAVCILELDHRVEQSSIAFDSAVLIISVCKDVNFGHLWLIRGLYEQTKVVASLLAAVGGLYLLGMCAIAGGSASSYRYSYDLSSGGDDHIRQSWVSLQGGFGTLVERTLLCVCCCVHMGACD
jgi:hypothetical protein